jgi:hypothetical protein
MSWLTNIFSDGASKLVDSVGNALDGLITSDEEKLQAKNELESIINDFKVKSLSLLAEYDKEVTERHANDMKSDSWLSKNIRPMSLAFMLVSVVGVMYLSIFGELSKLQIGALESWIPAIIGLTGVMVSFYFGSRGIEKVTRSKGK